MKDKTTGMPMRVSKDGRSGPYLTVPFEQVPAVKKALDEARIRHWADETAVAMSGGPLLTVINFGKTANPDEIQATLDGIP